MVRVSERARALIGGLTCAYIYIYISGRERNSFKRDVFVLLISARCGPPPHLDLTFIMSLLGRFAKEGKWFIVLRSRSPFFNLITLKCQMSSSFPRTTTTRKFDANRRRFASSSVKYFTCRMICTDLQKRRRFCGISAGISSHGKCRSTRSGRCRFYLCDSRIKRMKERESLVLEPHSAPPPVHSR